MTQFCKKATITVGCLFMLITLLLVALPVETCAQQTQAISLFTDFDLFAQISIYALLWNPLAGISYEFSLGEGFSLSLGANIRPNETLCYELACGLKLRYYFERAGISGFFVFGSSVFEIMFYTADLNWHIFVVFGDAGCGYKQIFGRFFLEPSVGVTVNYDFDDSSTTIRPSWILAMGIIW